MTAITREQTAESPWLGFSVFEVATMHFINICQLSFYKYVLAAADRNT